MRVVIVMSDEKKPFDGWTRASDYAIKFGPWIICKGQTPDGWRYNLWHHEKLLLPGLTSAQEAKDYVKQQASINGELA